MVAELSSDFLEIPEEVRRQVDREVEAQVFDLLHAEAVQRKDLPPAPKTLFDQAPGRIARLILQVSVGALFGTWAVVATVYAIRSLVTVM